MSLKVRLPYQRALKEAKQAQFDMEVERRAQQLFHEFESYTIDIVIIANLLALIEGPEKWGTGKRATRIPRHLENVEKIIMDACERYEHKFAFTALAKRLENYGITYERKSEK